MKQSAMITSSKPANTGYRFQRRATPAEATRNLPLLLHTVEIVFILAPSLHFLSRSVKREQPGGTNFEGTKVVHRNSTYIRRENDFSPHLGEAWQSQNRTQD